MVGSLTTPGHFSTLCTEIEHYKTDDSGFASSNLFNPAMMQNGKTNHTPKTAVEVLTDAGNMDLEVYPDIGQKYGEETWGDGVPNTLVQRRKTSHYRFQDLVQDHHANPEQII